MGLYTAGNRGVVALARCKERSERAMYLLIKRKPDSHYLLQLRRLGMKRFKAFLNRCKRTNRRNATVLRMKYQKSFSRWLSFIQSLLYHRNKGKHLSKNIHQQAVFTGYATDGSTRGGGSFDLPIETLRMFKKNQRYLVTGGYALWCRRNKCIALRWMHHLARARHPQRVLLPRLENHRLQRAFTHIHRKYLFLQKAKPIARKCVLAWCRLQIRHAINQWKAVSEDEALLVYLRGKHRKIRGIRKLWKLKNINKRLKKSNRIAYHQFNHVRKYEVIHMLRETVLGKRVIRHIKAQHCHYSLQRWLTFVKSAKCNRRNTEKIDNFRQDSLLSRVWLDYFKRRREQLRECRQRKLWINERRKALLRRGMQALEMQAARHWAIHERYITKIDVHKNTYSLKHAFKKIQQYQIEETEIRQRKLTVARKVAANSLTLKMQEAEKLAKEKERIKLGLSSPSRSHSPGNRSSSPGGRKGNSPRSPKSPGRSNRF